MSICVEEGHSPELPRLILDLGIPSRQRKTRSQFSDCGSCTGGWFFWGWGGGKIPNLGTGVRGFLNVDRNPQVGKQRQGFIHGHIFVVGTEPRGGCVWGGL